MNFTTTYKTPGNHNLQIPTKEEFNRYATNVLQETDFSSNHPAGKDGRTIKNIWASLNWTIKNVNPINLHNN